MKEPKSAVRYHAAWGVGGSMALFTTTISAAWQSGDPNGRGRSRASPFLLSNLGAPGSLAARRLEVARELSRWFTVAIPPRLKDLFPSDAKLRLVEVPHAPRAKQAFLSKFTLNLCFENNGAPGYLTEKPFDALISGAVPIYKGDAGVADWINPAGDPAGGGFLF